MSLSSLGPDSTWDTPLLQILSTAWIVCCKSLAAASVLLSAGILVLPWADGMHSSTRLLWPAMLLLSLAVPTQA